MGKLEDNLKDYQLSALSKIAVNEKTYIVYEVDKYTEYQNYLYNRKLKGLKAIPKKELDAMCNKKKQRIHRVYIKAQRILNRLKQQKTITYTNFIFESLFPNNPLTDFMLESTETSDKVINTLNFKDLKIGKDEIIAIFIEQGILGPNFLSLKEDPNKLPRLKNENKIKRM